jgi:hypothetical protein
VGVVTVTGATYKRTRVRGMAPWSPRPVTRHGGLAPVSKCAHLAETDQRSA